MPFENYLKQINLLYPNLPDMYDKYLTMVRSTVTQQAIKTLQRNLDDPNEFITGLTHSFGEDAFTLYSAYFKHLTDNPTASEYYDAMGNPAMLFDYLMEFDRLGGLLKETYLDGVLFSPYEVVQSDMQSYLAPVFAMIPLLDALSVAKQFDPERFSFVTEPEQMGVVEYVKEVFDIEGGTAAPSAGGFLYNIGTYTKDSRGGDQS